MGHVDGRDAGLLVKLLDLGAHRCPQLGIQVRQRLVKKESVGTAYQAAPHRHTLSLSAGQLCRASIQQVFDFQHLRGTTDTVVDRF